MKKRIFGFMSSSILLSIMLLSLLIGAIVAINVSEQMKTSLKTERVTIISETGEVLFDNYGTPETPDNHLNRPEVMDAFTYGYGESERYSIDLLEETYYYAMRFTDDSVLRMSITHASTYAVIYRLVPAFVISALCVAGVSFFAARYLSNKIIAPINNIDLNAPEIDTYDELAPFVREIMRQKKEIALRLSDLENRSDTIKAITGNMKEGLIITDKDGLILSANVSAGEIFRQNDMTDKNIIEVCRDFGLLHNIKLCLGGKSAETEFEAGDKTYAIYFNPVYKEDAVSGAVILFLEITEKLASEKQRREFSANVSHELKTPLTTISALTEMLGNGMVKEEDKQEFITKISGQTKRLVSIIDDIIKLSEFDEGDIVHEFSTFDVRELADSVAVSLLSKAKDKNVAIKVAGQNVKITANERMIDECLYNLTDNGIKYTDDGGSVTVTVEKDGAYCKITVSDTGIGIPEKHLKHIFERFYTADKSRSKKTGGTGLGLSIVKHAAEFHNGRVEVMSVEHAGTSVICYIPIETLKS